MGAGATSATRIGAVADFGPMPTQLAGLNLKYDGNAGVTKDTQVHEEETHVFKITKMPLISGLYPTSVLDASHALTDKATWNFLLTWRLESEITSGSTAKLTDQIKWNCLTQLVHSAPERMFIPFEGTHFGFIGETGAKDIAGKILELLNQSLLLQTELSQILNG